MSWTWSHTAEAYSNLLANISIQPREWLETVWCEWETARKHSTNINFHAEFNQDTYTVLEARVKNIPDDQLILSIQEWTSEFATCTTGGHFAHCCPYGCGTHELAFSLEMEQ